MINLIKWQNDAYQVVLEGTSFYYFKKMPVALRLPHDRQLIMRKEQFAQTAQKFVDDLSLLSRVVAKPVEEFKETLELAYKKAIFTGARRITMQRMHQDIELFEEDPIHVIKQKNDDRQTDDRDARDGWKRQAADPLD